MRLPAPAGTLIDRTHSVSFEFEKHRYSGFRGDTIASALAANDVLLLSRSFKYHRPRGAFTMSGDDANTLVQVGDEPNVHADLREIEDDLRIEGQNYVGSLKRDFAFLLDKLSRFLPVGFYYHAFFRPIGIWDFWEGLIRRTAGLGRIELSSRPRPFEQSHLHCDVAVVGGGPSGLAAALEAAGSGADVLIVERMPVLGGSLNHARLGAPDQLAADACKSAQNEVERSDRVRVLTNAQCVGWYADNWLAVVHGRTLYRVRSSAVVVATGDIEQPSVFRNNDLPGIISGSAAQRLINLYGVAPGRRAIVAASGERGYAAALDLIDAGIEVAAIVNPDKTPPDGHFRRAAVELRVPTFDGHIIERAAAGQRGHRIGGVVLSPLNGSESRRIPCDLAVISMDSTPAWDLLGHAGASLQFRDGYASIDEKDVARGVFSAGSVAGISELETAVEDGRRAGLRAASHAGYGAGTPPPPVRPSRDAVFEDHSPGATSKDFIDFDEDVQVKDIKNSFAEGFKDPELLKRYSSLGMGPSQGKISSLNGARVLAKLSRAPADFQNATTARPPSFPIKLGHLAGRIHPRERHTAMHHRHIEAGAEMMVAGDWLRPAHYGSAQDRNGAIQSEVLTIRNHVGLVDVSTLGKLEVRGPDAGAFLDRAYTLSYSRLRRGRTRYALMLDEAGTILDDGVVCRVADQHYYVTASSGKSEEVLRTLRWYKARWRMNVSISDLTSAFAAVNLAGPKARTALTKVCDDIDLSPEGFPYLGFRTGHVAGIPSRVFRIGFVGELSYEIHVPASQGEALWDAILRTDSPGVVRPVGVEALRILRLEKGHVILGQDTDSLTTPLELDLEWALPSRKRFYIGRRALDLQRRKGLRRRLAPFSIDGADAPLPLECNLVLDGDEIIGRVTSAARSQALNRVIGLAYVPPDLDAVGEAIHIKLSDGRTTLASVTTAPFYDPENARQEL